MSKKNAVIIFIFILFFCAGFFYFQFKYNFQVISRDDFNRKQVDKPMENQADWSMQDVQEALNRMDKQNGQKRTLRDVQDSLRKMDARNRSFSAASNTKVLQTVQAGLQKMSNNKE
jgi:hypothetical protein